MNPTRGRKASQALLLVDFINLFDFRNAAKLAPRAIKAAGVAGRLKASLAQNGVPCIYANDNFGNWRSEFSALVEICLAKGGASGAIAQALRPTGNDLSILKPRHSAFYGTPLEFLLEELGVRKIIIAGIAVDMCVVATAQDAYVRKYEIAVPADCCAGFSSAQEKEALSLMTRTMHADARRFGRSRS